MKKMVGIRYRPTRIVATPKEARLCSLQLEFDCCFIPSSFAVKLLLFLSLKSFPLISNSIIDLSVMDASMDDIFIVSVDMISTADT